MNIHHVIQYYTDLSREETLKEKEVKEFNDNLNSELDRVTNFRLNTAFIDKLKHPITTMKNNHTFRRLTKIKGKFDTYLEQNALLYVKEESGDIITDLDFAARYHKPELVKQYVRSVNIGSKK